MSRHHNVTRRGFVQGTILGGAAILGWNGTHAEAAAEEVSGKPAPGKIGDFKISLAEWSLHRRLFADRPKVAELNLDFPRMAREEFGIEAVEYVNQFFKDKAGDEAYLKALKQRASDQGVTNVLIMIDGEGDLSAPASDARKKAVENHKRWVDAAARLGCHAIRVNTGSHYSGSDVAAVAESCAALTEYGKKSRIKIICENHGGPSSDPNAIVALMKAVNDESFGTLPDFGNFPKQDGKYAIDVYDAIARMMPYAKGVSAKSYDFGPDGKETVLDYARILKIVTDAGYHGHVGIEYEGGRMSEPDGIKATRALLEKLRGSMYQA